MRIGIHTAQLVRESDPATVQALARTAEQLGYSSLWVLDRLSAPEGHRSGLDAVTVLALSAAVTSRIRLGTSVLVSPWCSPARLSERLEAVDRLPEDRVDVGLGLGWSVDEYEAAFVSSRHLSAKVETALDVLEDNWGDSPVALAAAPGAHPSHHRGGADGELDRRRSFVRPHPPVYLAAYSPAGLDRVARRADGWNPAGLPLDALGPMWAKVRNLAAGYGRDPDQLRLVVRATVDVTARAVDGERMLYQGSVEQVAGDIEATAALGADELVVMVHGRPPLDEVLDGYVGIVEAVDERAGAGTAA